MIHILLLGATGRTGAAILTALPADVHVTAALRQPDDAHRLADTNAQLRTQVVDITQVDSLAQAMVDADVVINAIRLREDIDHLELVRLHNRILAASNRAVIVTVGGAGTLHLPDGSRFWQSPAFPPATLPRGRAHAELRDYLESGNAGTRWTYLIPPPAYLPDGPAMGSWELVTPFKDESAFLRRRISYADFGAAVVAAVADGVTGTRLVAWVD